MGSQDSPDSEEVRRYLERHHEGLGSLTEVDRRDVMAGSAAALTISFAGCGGDGGGEDTTTAGATATETDTGGMDATATETETMAGDPTPLDATWNGVVSPRGSPDTLHWNRYNPKQNARGTPAWENLAGAHTGLSDSLFGMVLLQEANWDPSGPTLEFVMEDTNWWNGTPCDSQDLWTKSMMEAATNRRAHRVVANEYKQPDERTLRMKFGTSSNPAIMQTQAISRQLDTPYDQADGFFGDKADRVWDAHTGFEDNENVWETAVLDTVAEELTTQRIEDSQFGNGIFKIDEITSQELVCSIHDGHWNADGWAGMEGAQFDYAPQEDNQIQAFLSDDIELGTSIPQQLRGEVPDHAVSPTSPDSLGLGTAFNQTEAPFDNLNVRRGLMFAADRDRIVANQPESELLTVDERITGISVTEDLYIPSDKLSQYPTYGGTGASPDMAEEHLSTDDRLSKSGGQWMLNESAWQITFTQGGRGPESARTLGAILNEIGINTEVTVSESFWGKTFPGQEFQATNVAVMGWRFYPYNGFNEDVIGVGSLNFARNTAYPGATPNEGTVDRVVGEIDAPPFEGDYGDEYVPTYPDDYTETYSPPDMMEELLTSADPERNSELISRLAWVYTHTLPANPYFYGGDRSWWTTDDWNVPEEGSTNYTAGFPHKQAGNIGPKYEDGVDRRPDDRPGA